MSNLSSTDNYAPLTAAAIYASGSPNVTIVNSDFDSNYGMLGAIYLSNSVSAYVYNTRGYNNSGQLGGFANIKTSQSVRFESVTLTLNSAIASGGALYIYAGAFYDQFSTYQQNHAGGNGGAILVDSGLTSVIINSSVFIENSALDSGGALFLQGNATIINGTFSSNSGQRGYGGALFVDSMTASVSSSQFGDNMAQQGGAVYSQYSSFYMENTFLNGNKANTSFVEDPELEGGGVYATHSDFSCLNCTFNGNIATDGGALFSSTSNVTLASSTFMQNLCSGSGAAFSVQTNSQLSVSNTTFLYNTAYMLGGAGISGNSTLLIHNSTFSHNIGESGGALSILGSNLDSAPSYINSTLFSFNLANYTAGGAIYTQDALLFSTDCSFDTNSAASGGALCFSGLSSINITSAYIHDNTADGGGAISAAQSSTFFLVNSEVSSNRAGVTGGGLSIDPNAQVSILNCTIKNNSAVAGGGMFSEGSVTIANSRIELNQAGGQDGGGVVISDGKMALSNCTVANNTCFRNGAGVRITNGSRIFLLCDQFILHYFS
jgi:predicted outer membrane repeat protein